MQAAHATNLVRKQFLISEVQVKKLHLLAEKEGVSVAEMVRQAIDAYDPESPIDLGYPELVELVSSQLKEAIVSTKKANKTVTRTLKKLSQKEE